MPHLTIEYSANLDSVVDLQGLCGAMRDAMVRTGIFPLGGIRVRAFPCQTYLIADGTPDFAYMNMICKIGAGRDEETRAAAAETLYLAAEDALKPQIGARPFALSLDMSELDPVTSMKRYNTVHAALKGRD
ncbi:MAG: 5-carboxymethyl-2-hydroxymuconate Delta-isomerase [Pseudomonadota bacterium]